MLMSFSQLRRGPEPLFSSTPKKTFGKTGDIHASPPSTNGFIHSPHETPETHRSQSCPTSPVLSSTEPKTVIPSRELEVTSPTRPHVSQPERIPSRENDNSKQQTDVGKLSSKQLSVVKTGCKVVRRNFDCDEQRRQLKNRLLLALTELIPHKERLSIKLLVNYTIDDKDSDCIVIDETLYRSGTTQPTFKSKVSLNSSSDSGYAPDLEASPATKRRRLFDQIVKETNALDLTLHAEQEEQELEKAMSTEPDDINDELGGDVEANKTLTTPAPGGLKIESVNDTASAMRANVPVFSSTANSLFVSGISNGYTPIASTILSTAGMPLLDSSVLTLLPLLQQQQQQQHQHHQQQQQQNTRLFELPRLITNNDSIMSGTQPSVVSGSETAESILFKELQALIRANSCNLGVRNTDNILHSNLSNTKQFTIPNNCFVSQPTSNFLNSSATTSLVGFPLLNTITPEQMNAIQALLPTDPFIDNSFTNPSLSSLNLGPATLLNLKDKSTGLETIGIMPTANPTRPLSNPMASLLGQLALPQANTFSLRTLTNLSQLFNSNESVTTRPGAFLHTTTTTAATTTASNANNSTLGDIKFAPILSENMVNSNGRRHKTGLTDTMMNDLNPPNLTLPIPSIHDLAQNASLSGHEPNSNTAFLASERDMLTGCNGIGSGGGSYGSNQFMFGRRLAHARRFICNQCRENFSSLAELNRHTLETHNSFKCTICSAHFTQRSNLQRHSLKHVGFKPFTCNLCKKEYYRKDHLVRHIEVTHPNHDPKMNITVHLTSSECLDYLDRLQAEKQSPCSDELGLQESGLEAQVQELEDLKLDETNLIIEGEEEQEEEEAESVSVSQT